MVVWPGRVVGPGAEREPPCSGAVCGIAKGASILVADYQPPLMFEVGSFAFPVALMGLDALLRQREPGLSRAGGIAAAVAVTAGLALTAILAVVDNPADVVTSLATATMALATVASLLLLGLPAAGLTCCRHPGPGFRGSWEWRSCPR